MTRAVVAVFIVKYLCMFLGRLSRFRLDRTGVALLGTNSLISGGAVSLDQAAQAVDVLTLTLLFAFMVILHSSAWKGFTLISS